ncbi:MAG: hypothetical protein FJY86_04455 [Candidatus Diapherotrites archaeon]|uniref:Uncharacterized protein n=1 Tax=Candidatus Iainarchaeum sp. TaxID=3101447 RepID=A0A8T4CCA2_9ARCH|nr:hypothetical protein [Candidatus Diapherotrites archaeon]
MKKRTVRKGVHLRGHRRIKREEDNEEDDVFELATGENAPMFWGDVDKKLLHHRVQIKKKRRRNN